MKQTLLLFVCISFSSSRDNATGKFTLFCFIDEDPKIMQIINGRVGLKSIGLQKPVN